MALERLTYDAPARGGAVANTPATVRDRSDKADGPTAGTETADPLEFLARVTAHIPDKHQVMTRYYGWYANRPRGRRRAGEVTIGVAPKERLPRSEAQRRWVELLRRIYEVDPLACPRCAGPMRIVAFITARAVIDRILTHLAHRAAHPATRPAARGPPPASRTGAPSPTRTRRRAAPPRHIAPHGRD